MVRRRLSFQALLSKRPVILLVRIWCALSIALVIIYTYNGGKFTKNIINPVSRIRDAITTYKNVDDSSSRLQVLLHTYMRSGSSFTADILSHHPDVFYVFEPLHSIYYITKHIARPYFPFLNSRASILENKKNVADFSRKTIEKYLKCQVDDLDLFTLTSYHLMSSHSTSPYKNCTSEFGMSSIFSCLNILKKKCLEAKSVFIKTIRMDMEIGAFFLAAYPNLKFLHLIRDPRATLFSQYNTAEISVEEWDKSLFNVSRNFCETVSKDLDVVQKLQYENPGRVQILLYDEIAAQPLEIAQKIHDFVGLPFTEVERNIISRKTSGENLINISKTLSTDKGNSTQAANFWRGYADLSQVQLIDKACGPLLYDKLGFIYVREKNTLKDLNISLRKNGTVEFF